MVTAITMVYFRQTSVYAEIVQLCNANHQVLRMLRFYRQGLIENVPAFLSH
jgi:hypothetical protein